MSLLRLEHHDRVAVLTLDDPKRRNALSPGLVAEIGAAFDELEADDVTGAVVVTGAAPAFCAGADLGDLRTAGKDELERIYQGFLRVARSSLPTVAAVNGPAVGAGMNLALCCDVRLAARRAKFDTRFLDIGLHPGGGHTWMLGNAVGVHHAKAMVLFGEVLDGVAAAGAGLVWKAVEPDDLLPASIELATRAATYPKALLAATKQTMTETAVIPTHPEAVDRELETQLWSITQGWLHDRLK